MKIVYKGDDNLAFMRLAIDLEGWFVRLTTNDGWSMEGIFHWNMDGLVELLDDEDERVVASAWPHFIKKIVVL